VTTSPAGLGADVRAIRVVCHRELLRWQKDRGRLLAGLIQPLLFLFVLGTGISRVASSATGDVDYRTFLFPGVLATSVLFTAVFSGVSVVWDREFGFLREMLVAPIRRSSILLGKCLGGALVATAQGVVVLALAGLCGVPYAPTLLVALLVLLFLVSAAVTAFGLLLAARIRNMQTLMPIIQTVITPMMFLSGALYPLAGLPTWLRVATKLNPLTYAVQPMRHVVFDHLELSDATRRAVDPGVTWWGWQVPVWLQVTMLVGLGCAILAVAVVRFSRTD
jgi:daunorubicin resistance ABC transporter membrane protein